MGHLLRSADIIRQLKLHLPVHVVYPDPFGGTPVECRRDNLLALLVVDSADIITEGQYVAALYGEMGRLANAAAFAAERQEAEYRRWQAIVSNEYRLTTFKNAKKNPTVDETKNHYRSLPEYDARKVASVQLRAQAKIFEDLREAFAIKGRIIAEHSRVLRGYEAAARTEVTVDDQMQRLLRSVSPQEGDAR